MPKIFWLTLLFGCSVAAAPAIVITNLPSYGSSASLTGEVLEVDPATHQVAVFIYVPGAGWYSKPYCAAPLTSIRGDGSWTTDITTGGNDALATRVAALVVSTNFNQPCVSGLSFLPTNVFAQALCSAVVTRPQPGTRWLSFAGYDWWVKTSAGPVGPGPNYFSDSTSNIWVDAQGQLHARITNRSNQWQCAELVSARTFGYGSYRFELNSRVDNLNPNVVLGLFTWSDDPAYTHREIDVECSRWGVAADPNNAQFVVQPYSPPGHLVRYAVPAGLTNSTHLFTWQNNRIAFECQRGSYSPVPAASNIVASWAYSLAVPQTGDENVRINLWLMNGAAPTDNQEAEVVIKSFDFVPLAPASSVTLTNSSRWPDGSFHFSFKAQPDWHYTVQESTHPPLWQDAATFLATNGLVEFFESAAEAQKFFRALTLP